MTAMQMSCLLVTLELCNQQISNCDKKLVTMCAKKYNAER